MNGWPDEWLVVIDELKELHKPKKIADYIVVASNDKKKLSQLISEWSLAGYCLYFGPFTNKENENQGQEICQAMVKYDDGIN